MSIHGEEERIIAAKAALDYVGDGMKLGIGSGRAVARFIEALSLKLKEEDIAVKAVPTSVKTELLCLEHGIPLTTLNENPRLELCVDGADQVERCSLYMIKGGGGALLREKIVASAADTRIIIIEEKKLVEKLDWRIPVEVLPFALGFCLRQLERLGRPEIREGAGKLGPVVTDNGNYIVDLDVGAIEDPYKVEEELNRIPGVLGTGLFIDLADKVIVGKSRGRVETLERSSHH
ncbi:MAG: ribose-5-phosphate isomerase RpiA [Candidatus Bathyarchaeia archaeon]